MALRTRLLLIVGLVVTAMLLLAGYVGHSAGERMRAALLQARDAHLLNTFRAHAEYRLALGLTLDQLDGLQLLLERERASAPSIVSIDVFAASGALAYSTDRSAVGTDVAPAWVARIGMPEQWQIDAPSERVVGTRLENDLGEAVGGVAVTLAKPVGPSAVLDLVSMAPLRAHGWRVALAAGCVLLAGLCALAVVRWLLAPYQKTAALLRADRRLASSTGLPGSGEAAQPLAAPLPSAGAFAHEALARRAVWASAEARIARLLTRLRAMDDVG
ncbi:MAG: hypothetical protein NTV19_06160 [Burkholderiales bacterium]|nr:hypothetical protein [Burkholderiales bacterium]